MRWPKRMWVVAFGKDELYGSYSKKSIMDEWAHWDMQTGPRCYQLVPIKPAKRRKNRLAPHQGPKAQLAPKAARSRRIARPRSR
jgi:hypothetical protein